jgi:hypothetical protein
MIVRINTVLANRMLDLLFNPGTALPALFDGGTAYFRTGVQPADADNAPSGIVVATIALAADAMAAAAGASISKNPTAWQDLAADAAGTITWARFVNAGATMWIDFDVTDTLGAGAIKVDNPAVLLGQQIIITSFTVNQPRTT